MAPPHALSKAVCQEVKDHRCQAEKGHVSFRVTTAQTAKLPLSQLYATVSKRPWQEEKIQQQIGGKVAQLRAHSMDVQYWLLATEMWHLLAPVQSPT